MKGVVELLDLPDELILVIMKRVNPHVLFLCAMIDFGNNRLEQLAFDSCHSIDLTFNYRRVPVYKLLMKRFYSDVMPRIIHNIKSLTINLYDTPSMIAFAEKNCNGTLPKLTHLKIMLGAKLSKSRMPFTKGNHETSIPELRRPLVAIVPQFFLMPHSETVEKLATLCRSSLMHCIQSFEIDEYFILIERLDNSDLRFDQAITLTHLRISLWKFDQCVHLLKQLGSQLHSFTVSVMDFFEPDADIISEIRSLSFPNLKQMTMTIYRNINNYEPCIFLLQRLSNIEYLTLLLAIGKKDTTHNHFIDGFFLETNIVSYMPHLRQFNFHIRSILKNVSHLTIDRIRQSFLKHEQPYNCVLDYFKNNYGQCQIYSLPFIGNRLDFISNRFPLFDINNTFSNVTILLLFDDVKPFENVFLECVARALPQLHTLEIINQLEQQEKTTEKKTNIDFAHLAALILYDIHMDYAEQLLCQTHLPSLIELVINKDILIEIISQNQQQAGDNCSRVGSIQISKPSYESIDAIQNFFPLVGCIRHGTKITDTK